HSDSAWRCHYRHHETDVSDAEEVGRTKGAIALLVRQPHGGRADSLPDGRQEVGAGRCGGLGSEHWLEKCGINGNRRDVCERVVRMTVDCEPRCVCGLVFACPRL